MNKITPEIIAALKKAVEKSGSLSQFARESGISQGTLSRYISQDVKSIQPSTWKQLFPRLELPMEYKNVYTPSFGAGESGFYTTCGGETEGTTIITGPGKIVLRHVAKSHIQLSAEIPAEHIRLLGLLRDSEKCKLMEEAYDKFRETFNAYASKRGVEPLKEEG